MRPFTRQNVSSHSFKRSKPIDWESTEFDLSQLPENKVTYGSIDVFEDRIGRRLQLPIIGFKGEEKGPVLGLTAAVHGNEINGIPTIHRLFETLDSDGFKGALIAVPVVNLPGYLAFQREFIDGVDLNRVMPGKDPGPPSQIYAKQFVDSILTKFTYHIDLHTASFGRINSLYIRSNLGIPVIREISKLQHADIVVNAIGPKKSVRQAALNLGIPSITIELGNPQVFQHPIVDRAIKGIRNVMAFLDMINHEIELPKKNPVFCTHSYWTRVHDGGVLRVHPKLTQFVEKDEKIATMYDIYGRKEIEYFAPERGIVIGKSVNPVASTGDRVIHLGIPE